MSYKYEKLIQEIAASSVIPALGLSIRAIADEVEKRTGERPANNTIVAALVKMGARAAGRKFVYKKRGNDNDRELST